ncbi:bifunctional metallophosphatase/5'-nucleotidase [Paenibacillus humicola]|uniref:bifunctional metallophosphatase/5'-nucleotidase n=1 Tax=Paenibacillus humicola TaxID=3110540 RepID=UPI00237AF3E8|nr:bifunctional metallophosphatase/5'-nucleotidase [Paenibacillus humicola]
MSVTKCRVVILETSDLHGFIFPRSYADHAEARRGLAKVAGAVSLMRREHPQTLLIDNGDCLQGTPLTYYHARVNDKPNNPVVACMNELRYDAAVPGNHEFNYGLPYLQSAVRASRFPWLSANTVDIATGKPYFGRPYLIRQFDGGLRVGLLGLTTSYIPNWEQPAHIAGIRFEDPVDTARKWVDFLKQTERVDAVIVSYHGGFERDLQTGRPSEKLTGENVGYAICENVPGIDVLLTGHQHRAIAGSRINGVCIVQPANEGRFLGKVTLTAERHADGWNITETQSELIPADRFEPDPAVLEIAGEVEALAQTWLDQPIGFVEGSMAIDSHEDVRLREHPLIEFINRVQMDVSGADISNTALFDNQSPGFGERITMRDIVANYIYPNTLKVIRVSGRDIRAALEQSAEYFELGEDGRITVSRAYLAPKPQHYNYDMWEGIDYVLDISKPAGQRVTKLERDGKPLDENEQFEVVMNNYRAGGGGNFTMFQGKPVIKDIAKDMVEILADYIRERRTIKAEANGNWKIIGGAGR